MNRSLDTDRAVDRWLADAEQHGQEVMELVASVRRLRAILPSDTREPTPRAIVRNALVEVLNAMGKPEHRNTIYDTLCAQGIVVSGKNPINNMGSILSQHSDVFVSHGQGVWGLRAWQKPRALYNGRQDDKSEGWDFKANTEDYPEDNRKTVAARASDNPDDLPW